MDLDYLRKVLINDCLLQPGAKVVVGVSGGPDSLCLVDCMVRLEFEVICAHFNHHLRPEAAKDAAVVEAAAQQMRIPFVTAGERVDEWARNEKRTIEEAARILRYRFLFKTAHAYQADAVAVGHTADDQVETLLMHLLRGAGLAGLKGMAYRSLATPWDAEIPLIRPLLFAWREETLGFCLERGLPYVMDASNQDTAFLRNRIRHELIPYLANYNPQIKQALWRTSQVLAGDASLVQETVDAAWKTCLDEQRPTYVALRLPPLRNQSHPMQRALLRRAVQVMRPSSRELDYEVIERAVDFLHSPARSGQMEMVENLYILLEPGVEGLDRVLIAEQALAAGRTPPEDHWPQLEPGGEGLLQVPGRLALSSGWEFESAWVEAPEAFPQFDSVPSIWQAWLDASTLQLPLLVRCPRPGDRFQPLGMDGRSLKLSDFWVNEKLPRRARAGWPLVCSGELIVWVPGFRPAHPFRVTGSSKRLVHLQLRRIT